MKWLLRPIFSNDGQTITFEKYKLVRIEDIQIVAVMNINEYHEFYGF